MTRPSSLVFNEEASSAQTHDSLSLQLPDLGGKFHKGTSGPIGVVALVKGKKAFARARASPPSLSPAANQERDNSFSKVD